VRLALIFGVMGLLLTLLSLMARWFRQLFSPLAPRVRWIAGISAGAITTFLALWSFSLAAAQPDVRDILVGTNYERTRVSISVDQTVAYQLYVLQSPDRVVIDLPSV